MINKKKLLIGTTNKEKFHIISNILGHLPIDIFSLESLKIDFVVTEDGLSPQENALKKAKNYGSISKLSTFALDASLYIDNFPKEKQPGLFVKKIAETEKDANESQILDYYLKEIKKNGGESKGKYEVGMALVTPSGYITSCSYYYNVKFVSRKSEKVLLGAPLSSISIDPRSGKYFSDLNPNERPDAKWIFGFIKENLAKI